MMKFSLSISIFYFYCCTNTVPQALKDRTSWLKELISVKGLFLWSAH
jgi:hypothetical protein